MLLGLNWKVDCGLRTWNTGSCLSNVFCSTSSQWWTYWWLQVKSPSEVVWTWLQTRPNTVHTKSCPRFEAAPSTASYKSCRLGRSTSLLQRWFRLQRSTVF
jgi:hypothetical protein